MNRFVHILDDASEQHIPKFPNLSNGRYKCLIPRNILKLISSKKKMLEEIFGK